MKNKRNIIISVIVVFIIIVIILGVCIFNFSQNKEEKNKIIGPKYSIQKNDMEKCKFSYEKLCFNIPDDYKCIGKNKCQLSNDKDMLLVQVFVNENYKNDLSVFIKEGNNNFTTNLVEINEVELQGNTWTVAKARFSDEKYYFLKIDNTVYSIRLYSKKDSKDNFSTLQQVIESSIKIK